MLKELFGVWTCVTKDLSQAVRDSVVNDFKPVVFVACYNQESEVSPFIQKLLEFFPREQIVVVDDGSSDDSKARCEASGLKVIRHTENLGVGAAIRTGVKFAVMQGFSHIVMMSANGKMDPSQISRLLEPIKVGNVDYVTGSRFLVGGAYPGLSFFRRNAIKLFSFIWWILTGYRFSDITCGFRAYSLEFVNSLDINQSWLNRYEMEYYIHYWACRRKLRILEVPVTIRYNHLAANRISKIKPFIGWWSMVRPLILLVFGFKK